MLSSSDPLLGITITLNNTIMVDSDGSEYDGEHLHPNSLLARMRLNESDHLKNLRILVLNPSQLQALCLIKIKGLKKIN